MCIKKQYNNEQDLTQDNKIYSIYIFVVNDNHLKDIHIAYVDLKEEAIKTVEEYNKILYEYQDKYLKFDDNGKCIIQEQLSEEFNKENKLDFVIFNIKDLKYTHKFGYKQLPKIKGRHKWW